VPSLTLYATPTSTSGVTLNATTPSGASSNFIVNAVYAHDGKYIDANTPALRSISTPGYSFAGDWGVFGADGFADFFQGGHASLPTPGGDTNHSTVIIGGNSTAAQVGVYGRRQSGPAYLAGALAFTNYWFNTNREAFNSDPLSGQFGAQSFDARAEAGYRFNMPASTLSAMTWTPYAAVQPQTFHSQAFSETDVLAGGLALNYQANDTVDTRTEIGARLATSAPLLNGMAVDFQGRAAWAHDFVSTPSLGVAFQSLPGSSFCGFWRAAGG
jgi:outer membrane autotransporter protein